MPPLIVPGMAFAFVQMVCTNAVGCRPIGWVGEVKYSSRKRKKIHEPY